MKCSRVFDKIWKNQAHKKATIVGIILVSTVLMSVVFSLVLRADTATTASFDPENGTKNGVTVLADGSAAGGSAIRFGVGSGPVATMTLAVNGATKYQTMDGFGTSVNTASWDDGQMKPALDMLIDQNGSKIFRVVVEQADWEAVNDNADPANFNWTYYNSVYASARFDEVWNTISYLNQKGITGNIILDFMGAGPTWMGGRTLAVSAEDEWVEMVVSAAYYAKNTRGLQFGMFAPNNEMDWNGAIEGILMNSTINARAMNKVGQRLDALGMSNVRLVGPDTADIGNGFDYMDKMFAIPSLAAKVDHIALHSYSASTGGADARVKDSAYPAKNFWISEFSIFTDVFPLLSEGAAGLITWDGFDSVYQHSIANGNGSTAPNDAGNAPAMIAYNSSSKIYSARRDLYNFGQLFKYVAPGMQRVDAVSSKTGLQALAFVHPTTGSITIFGRNTTGSSQVIGGTLASTPNVTALHYIQTNSSSNMATGSDVTITNGSYTVTVPNNTVFTLTTL